MIPARANEDTRSPSLRDCAAQASLSMRTQERRHVCVSHINNHSALSICKLAFLTRRKLCFTANKTGVGEGRAQCIPSEEARRACWTWCIETVASDQQVLFGRRTGKTRPNCWINLTSNLTGNGATASPDAAAFIRRQTILSKQTSARPVMQCLARAGRLPERQGAAIGQTLAVKLNKTAASRVIFVFISS